MGNIDFIKIFYLVSTALIPMLLGMICHEVAHGWVASKVGDPTASNAGRLNFNPFVHLDRMGTTFFLLTALLSSAAKYPFIFGWAKPVPINPRNFRNLRSGLILVSIAGAVANILLAIFSAIILRISLLLIGIPRYQLFTTDNFFINICEMGVLINCTLACFNLIPIPPLDGSKVLGALLPLRISKIFFKLERYGMFILLLLVATGIFGKILGPMVVKMITLLYKLTGIIS